MHATDSNTSPAARRYSCHECRDDAEVVVLGKAHPKVVDTYLRHVRTCADCRRHDAVLRALYVAPPSPRVPDLATQEREFGVILERARHERAAAQARGRRRRGSVVALAATAILATMWLAFPRDPANLAGHAGDEHTSAVLVTDRDLGAPGDEHAPAQGGLEHRAQTFARIVAGEARLGEHTRTQGEGAHLAAGATFEVTDPHGVQMAIVGKLLASFEPGSIASFDAANPDVVEIGLRRGMLAIRYDRLPADPILLIRTPSAVVRVVGTVFTVAVDDEGRTSVSVLRGHVEVLEPDTLALLAEVDAGFRFDGGTSTYVDVGRDEVSAALPVSNESVGEETTLADGQIPTTWIVPGLPAQPEYRTLDRVSSTSVVAADGITSELELGEAVADAKPVAGLPPTRGSGVTNAREAAGAARVTPPLPRSLQARASTDDGAGLLDLIAAEVEQSRKTEVAAALEACRSLYASPETRFRAAACLTKFQREFGDEPGAEEGLLLIGILRMDFAQDHQAAIRYFERFLKRSPDGPLAELAHYRIFLAATERGIVSDALRKGREYLQRYPEGRYVGRVIQRFPELKRSL